MRKKSALRRGDRAPTLWITLDTGPVIWTDASKGTHFRVLVTENATLEPPLNAVSGQPFLWRLEWMASATVTLHSSFAVRGTVALPTAAGSVYYLSGVYDDDGGVCDVLGTPDLSSVYDAAGTAAAAVAAHALEADPHPTYLTLAEGDAAYEPLHTTEAWALANDTPARSLDVSTLTDPDAIVVANHLAALVRDVAALKRPTL